MKFVVIVMSYYVTCLAGAVCVRWLSYLLPLTSSPSEKAPSEVLTVLARNSRAHRGRGRGRLVVI